ncbi:MAG: histidine kinase [Proteobacteria bacterium]|nr:histidine kinase [Pseudomonadota bacterium]
MNFQIRYASSELTDPVLAVAEFARQMVPDEPETVIFFCSPDYDLNILGREMQKTFRCPCIGCTSSGQADVESSIAAINKDATGVAR